MQIKVHIDELNLKIRSYKERRTDEGKPKERLRKNYDDTLTLNIEIEQSPQVVLNKLSEKPRLHRNDGNTLAIIA